MRRAILFVFAVFCLSHIESVREAIYSITRNVQRDLLSQQTEFFSAGSFSLSACTNLCTYHSTCISALNDEKTKQCYLFTSILNVSVSEESTEVTYVEKDDCSWIHRTTGDCCYAGGTMSCLDHNLYPVFKDCQDAFDHGERKSGGIYFLRPEQTWRLIRAVCMFDSQSGWTVIQRRLDGSVDFERGWDDYVDGFGDLNGEYWIGLDNIYYLTRENQKLSIYLEAHDGDSRIANYSTFYIDDGSTEYVNHIDGYTGDAGNSWISIHNHNNERFSTFDNDNDPSPTANCAMKYKSGWWFDWCTSCNLNGLWYPDGVATKSYTGILWREWKGGDYSYKVSYMKLGR